MRGPAREASDPQPELGGPGKQPPPSVQSACVLGAGLQASVLPALPSPSTWQGVLVLTGVGDTVPAAPSAPRAAGSRASGAQVQLRPSRGTWVTAEENLRVRPSSSGAGTQSGCLEARRARTRGWEGSASPASQVDTEGQGLAGSLEEAKYQVWPK